MESACETRAINSNLVERLTLDRSIMQFSHTKLGPTCETHIHVPSDMKELQLITHALLRVLRTSIICLWLISQRTPKTMKPKRE